jgi:hypothetical protein
VPGIRGIFLWVEAERNDGNGNGVEH